MADQNDITLQQLLNKLKEEQRSLEEKILDSQNKSFELTELTEIAQKKKKAQIEKLLALEEQIDTLERGRLSNLEALVEKFTQKREIQESIVQQTEEQIEAQEDLNEEIAKSIAQLEQEIIEGVKNKTLKIEEIKQRQELIVAREEDLKLGREHVDMLKTSLESEDALRVAYKQQENASKIIGENVAGIGASLGLAANVNETWLGKMKRSWDISTGIAGTLSMYKAAFKDMLAPSNIFASLISKIAQSTALMVAQTDGALASFNQATGAGGRFNEQIVQIGDSSLEFGVGLQESAKAFEALHGNMTQFTTLSKDAQNRAATLTSQLQGIGVSAETTATNLDLATQALGMTIDEAIASQTRLAELSEQLGVAPQKLAADFGAAVPALAAHGPKMESVFVDLAKQAKATGIEVGSLISIAKQFDTFEGAATAAGKLNAILGGGLLNSAELLTATEAERIAMLRESIELSGRNFDSMNKFEKMAIASAAGITDMAEASKLFGSTSIEFTKMQKEQKTLQERAAASADIQKKLNNMMQMFAVAVLPVVNALHSLFDALFWLNNKSFGVLIPLLTGAIGILALVVKGYQAWNAVTGVATALTGTHTAAVAANTTAQQAATTASGGFTKALSSNAANLVKLGVALLLAGTGIALATAGIALLAHTMKGMGLEAIALVAIVVALSAAMVGFVLALAAIAPVAAAIGPILIPLGVAVLLFGAAIGLAAAGIGVIVFGIASLVEAFGSFFKILIDGAPALPATAAGMMLIAGALTALSFAGLGIISVGAAFGVLTAGVVSLAAALALIGTEELLAVSDIAKGISGITIDKSVAFSGAMESLEGTVTALSTVPPATMANVTEFVRRISEVTAVAGAGGAPGIAGAPGATGAAGAAGAAVAGGMPGAGEREIVLKIGEREFGRAIINILNKEMKLNLVGN